jgi:hypothetical protein
MQTYWLLFPLLLVAQAVKAQTGSSIQVNTDGTHSTIFYNGTSSTRVNPDETHSVFFHNESSSIVVIP